MGEKGKRFRRGEFNRSFSFLEDLKTTRNSVLTTQYFYRVICVAKRQKWIKVYGLKLKELIRQKPIIEKL